MAASIPANGSNPCAAFNIDEMDEVIASGSQSTTAPLRGPAHVTPPAGKSGDGAGGRRAKSTEDALLRRHCCAQVLQQFKVSRRAISLHDIRVWSIDARQPRPCSTARIESGKEKDNAIGD